MSVTPAATAAWTASAPKPLVTATSRTRSPPPAASIRDRTPATRASTSRASITTTPAIGSWRQPGHEGVAPTVVAGPVGPVLGGAGGADADVGHAMDAGGGEPAPNGGREVERRSPGGGASPYVLTENGRRPVEVGLPELVAGGTDARPDDGPDVVGAE